MKTQAMIISVDPGKKTLGRFWEEGLPYNGTVRQIIRTVSQTPSFGNPGSLLLGVGRKTSHSYAFMLLLIRVITGVAMIASGIFLSNAAASAALPIVLISAGTMLILGLLGRIASAATAAFCIITLASALADGQAPAYLIAMLGVISGVTILTAILGPGVFSCDRLLRRAFIKMEHRRTLKNRARRCSYQAFKYAS